MFENKTEEQAKKEILTMVAEYCNTYHNKKKPYEPGDRITYAARVYDQEEMCNLVDSALEFWLTSGRYTEKFEKAFSEYLGVRYCSLVNSGSSANLCAFMALTSPLLGERQVKPGDEMITVAAGFPTTEFIPSAILHNSNRLGSVGAFNAYPVTFAPTIINSLHIQEPLKPVWPVINTLLSL